MGVTTTTAAANTYVPIATTTLGSSASTISFSSIPTTYTDLVYILSGTSSTGAGVYWQVGNGTVDTGTNYSYTELYGTGSAAASTRATSNTSGSSGSFYTTQSTNILQLQNYSNTTTYKTMLSRGSNANNQIDAFVNLWRSTAAINIITFSLSSGTFATGTTATLYGILAA